MSWWRCFLDWLVKSVHDDCTFSVLSDKSKVLIKPHSKAIAKCFEDTFFFFLAEHYIVIGVITKETNYIDIVAVYV